MELKKIKLTEAGANYLNLAQNNKYYYLNYMTPNISNRIFKSGDVLIWPIILVKLIDNISPNKLFLII